MDTDTNTSRPERLAALGRCKLMFSHAEERFDRITRIAAYLLHSPISTLSLVDGEREWFKSRYGTELDELPLAAGLGQRVISEGSMVVHTDATNDPALRGHPLVAGEPYIRFYAGYPILSPDREVIGVLSVMDHRPHFGVTGLRRALADLGSIVENEIYMAGVSADVRDRLLREFEELHHRALTDALTGTLNRGAIFDCLSRELARSRRKGLGLAVMMVDLDHFKQINDSYGHLAGDEALRECSRRLRELVRNYDGLGRYGGEEFMVVLPECSLDNARIKGERMRASIADAPVVLSSGKQLQITTSVGIAISGPELKLPAERMIHVADQALYRAKELGRNRIEIVDLSTLDWQSANGS